MITITFQGINLAVAFGPGPYKRLPPSQSQPPPPPPPPEAHLATKGDAKRIGVLRHDELSHVSQSEVWSDRVLSPLWCLAHLHSQAARPPSVQKTT